MNPALDDPPEPCGCGDPRCDCAYGQCWCNATSGEIAAEVLRVFPGSFITGSRWVDTAECPDDQQRP